jgi:hypothetical protein
MNTDLWGFYQGDIVEVVAKPAGMHEEPTGGSDYSPFCVAVANSVILIDSGTPMVLLSA